VKSVSEWRHATSPSDEPPPSSRSGDGSRRWRRNGHAISPEFERIGHEFGVFRFGYHALFCTQFRSGKRIFLLLFLIDFFKKKNKKKGKLIAIG
jgi:hypothetical protein